MCVLCSQLWVEDHWSDAASASDARDIVTLETHAAQRGLRIRERTERVRLFNRILASRGLLLQDWEGSSYILRDGKGRSSVVSNLAQVWHEVEQMTGAALDPLDPALIADLRARSTG